jgi:hypothetical protein
LPTPAIYNNHNEKLGKGTMGLFFHAHFPTPHPFVFFGNEVAAV